ncbi:MAG TPA: hypothetical protein VF286_02920, partial [Acidiphilium sp.]
AVLNVTADAGRVEFWRALADACIPDGTQSAEFGLDPAALAVPVRIAWGTCDRIVPVGQLDRVGGAVAQHRLDGVGHVPQVEDSARLARILREMLGTE